MVPSTFPVRPECPPCPRPCPCLFLTIVSPFSAIMDILRRLHVAANDDVQRAEKTLSEIVSMQTGLVKGLDTTER